MRIVLVVPGGVDPPDAPGVEGVPRVIPFVHHLVRTLASAHDVHVIAVGHDPQPGAWQLFGATVTNVPVGRHGKADIARVLATVPGVVGRGGRPDVVHGLWANLPGLAAVAAAKRWRCPSVVSVCGGEFAAHQDIEYGGGLRNGTRRLALTAARGATAVTVATEWMRAHVQAAGAPVSDIVPLGADPQLFTPAPAAVTGPFALVHIGGLNRVKDQDLLLHAMALLVAAEPRATLTIAGGDALGGQHERLTSQLGIADHVRFLGHVAHDALPAVLQGASVHVLTSRHDAGPVAVLEAAACGVPTVGTDVGHVHDFAALSPAAAVAVHDRSPAALADALLAVVSEPARRDTLAAAALDWAVAHDAAHTAATFEQLYRRLAASSARR
ncbi:MAG: glycosyltransferase family 4 protein [Ilumatobacteraceae bacterium]